MQVHSVRNLKMTSLCLTLSLLGACAKKEAASPISRSSIQKGVITEVPIASVAGAASKSTLNISDLKVTFNPELGNSPDGFTPVGEAENRPYLVEVTVSFPTYNKAFNVKLRPPLDPEQSDGIDTTVGSTVYSIAGSCANSDCSMVMILANSGDSSNASISQIAEYWNFSLRSGSPIVRMFNRGFQSASEAYRAANKVTENNFEGY